MQESTRLVYLRASEYTSAAVSANINYRYNVLGYSHNIIYSSFIQNTIRYLLFPLRILTIRFFVKHITVINTVMKVNNFHFLLFLLELCQTIQGISRVTVRNSDHVITIKNKLMLDNFYTHFLSCSFVMIVCKFVLL